MRTVKVILQEPTLTFVIYILKTAHYLNNPKHMYNSMIHDLVRGNWKDKAIENLTVFFKNAGDKKTSKEIESIVYHFQHTPIQEFMKINVNDTNDGHEEARKVIDKKIDAYMIKHQTYYSAIYGGGKKNQPSYPFRKNL